MMHLKILISFFIFLNIFLVDALAGTVTGTNFDIRGPDSVTTTVGEFTEVRIDVFNKGSVQDSYTAQITGTPANVVEITNPSLTTQTVSPKQTTQITSNIRALTGDNSVITFTIISVGTSEQLALPIPVSSKKFSLPEFGLIGFLQIVLLAGIIYFLLANRMLKKPKLKRKRRR